MKIMGIVNVTPDSFSDGGEVFGSVDKAIEKAMDLYKLGASYIDIGGESTRPGSDPIDVEEELNRVIPVIEKLKGKIPNISVDTYKSKVAEKAILSGATMVNDISGLRFDPNMVDVVASYDVEVVIMHIKGTPKDMQKNPFYEDVIDELLKYFDERVNFAIKRGIKEHKIWIDPGIGFGKRLEDNIKIMNNIDKFKKFGLKILMGTSRKSFIDMLLEYNTQPKERDFGTIATTLYFYDKGIDMVRVHNVEANIQALKVYKAIKEGIY